MRWTIPALLLVSASLSAAEPVDYLRDIKPLLKERCFACHGSLKQKAGLRLDTIRLMHKGGENGPALEAGRADKSVLLERVSTSLANRRMPPPNEGEPLSPKEIARLRLWIEQGARGPATEKAEADPREHWAFRVPQRPPLPTVKNPDWQRHPIDAFVAMEHERHQVVPQSSAARATLLRRVYIDLTGLPPTRAELHAFLNDLSPTAYEKIVDRLLASPQYGERWARHWMDVWRYSDWYGRRAVPDVWNSAPQIWRWRDWIIASLNQDKGYDRMVQEMLAADEIAPGDDAAAVATGYLVRNWYALNPNQWMRDIVEHTGKAFLGLTFNCAHCHDHKYDPIAHEDYFRLRAFFEPLQLRQDRVPGEGDPGPFQKYDYAKLRKVVKIGSVGVFDENPDAKTFVYLQGDERLRAPDKAAVSPGVPAFLGRIDIEKMTLPDISYYPGLKSFLRQEEIAQRKIEIGKVHIALMFGMGSPVQIIAAVAELQALESRLAADDARYRKTVGDPAALARAASKAERLAAKLAAGAKWLAAVSTSESARQRLAATPEGKEKDAAALALNKAEQQATALKTVVDQAAKNLLADNDKYTPLSPLYPSTSTGRRRALAQWMTARTNPLTARVAVNHIWMRHFERPLVETVFDFGRNGKKPTHPALLDWLAVEFMESGWRMKHLHRLIVTSNTYRQASSGGSENVAHDPDNRFLWRYSAHRVEAEVVRDSILDLAGDLDRTIGGPVLDNNLEHSSKRRSLYFSVYPEDGGNLKFLEIFDAPDTCDCYRRAASVMPQQALALANNQLAVSNSRILARKLGETSDEDFSTAAFEQVLSRTPTRDEQQACTAFLKKQAALYRATPASELKGPTVPGIAAPSLDPQLRARESLVRALFSHHEFVTIR